MYYYSNFDEIFDSILNNKNRSNQNYTSTTLVKKGTDGNYEINHTKDGAYFFFDAPGFNKNNLKVEVEDGVLYITGSRTYKIDGEEKTKSISKEFKIGEGYKSESIEATIEDGLLTVFVPNYKKQKEKKRISIL